jgi:hypothetical protein
LSKKYYINVGKWEIEVRELHGGPVGLLLRGPRGREIYIPPIHEEYINYRIPKYVFKYLMPILKP